MLEQILIIKFFGPFSWTAENSIFKASLGKKPGIYLWTIPYAKGGDLVYYVGETGRSFSTRMKEHFLEHMSGGYHLYDPAEFLKGNKKMLWPGRYDPKIKTTIEEFLEKYSSLKEPIETLAKLYRFWLAPVDIDKRLRERIEAGIATFLYSQPGIIGKFQDEGIRYRGRKDNENPVEILIETEGTIIGMPKQLII